MRSAGLFTLHRLLALNIQGRRMPCAAGWRWLGGAGDDTGMERDGDAQSGGDGTGIEKGGDAQGVWDGAG